MRQILPLAASLAVALTMSGCDRTADSNAPQAVASGAVAFRLSDTVAGTLSTQADSLRLTATRPGQASRVALGSLDGFLFLDSLPAGRWTLEVVAFRFDGSVSWAGTDSVDIQPGRTADAVVHLRRASGNVRVRVVLDTAVPCSLVVVRLDTIHPVENVSLSSLRPILGIWVDTSGITIRTVYDPRFAKPTLRFDADSLTMTLGDPFFECGGIVGPCTVAKGDTVRFQDVFVSGSELPSGGLFLKGLDTVVTVRLQRLIPHPVRIQRIFPHPISDTSAAFHVFSWRSQGGISGLGSGESVSLTSDGALVHVVRDSLGYMDSLYANIGDSLLRRARQVLDDSMVRSLPGVMDTSRRLPMADQFTDLYEIFGGVGPSDGAVVFLRYVDDHRPCAAACPESQAHQALVSLVDELRAVPAYRRIEPWRGVGIP